MPSRTISDHDGICAALCLVELNGNYLTDFNIQILTASFHKMTQRQCPAFNGTLDYLGIRFTRRPNTSRSPIFLIEFFLLAFFLLRSHSVDCSARHRDLRKQDSGFAEGAALYDACAFPDGDKLTGGKCGVFLDESKRPTDLNVGGCSSAEAEVQPGIAGGE